MYAINSECIMILHKICKLMKRGVDVVFVATFNNISVKSCRSVLFVEETGGSAEKTIDLSYVTDKPYHMMGHIY